MKEVKWADNTVKEVKWADNTVKKSKVSKGVFSPVFISIGYIVLAPSYTQIGIYWSMQSILHLPFLLSNSVSWYQV